MDLLCFLLFAAVTLGSCYGHVLHRRATGCQNAVNLTGNPFATRTLHPTKFYRAEVSAAAAAITDASLKAKALRVAEFGTFFWVNSVARIADLETELQDVPRSNILGIVVKDLPKPNCGIIEQPPPTYDISYYKKQYIDRLVETIKKYSNVAVAAIFEPGALPYEILNTSSCVSYKDDIREGATYALKQLNIPNVMTYIDIGQGGSLCWNDLIKPAAQEIGKLVQNAGSLSQLRGFSTNVASYNAWNMHPGEFEPADDSQYPNKCLDEERYVSLFGGEMAKYGVPLHAITDTSRNAVQGLRAWWNEDCNVNGAGLGLRPTANTRSSQLDAFVWVKSTGESDGTSDPKSPNYDPYCGKPSAFKPSPEAGQWNQAYFEMLVRNAKPPL